jgi:hypothetical protein
MCAHYLYDPDFCNVASGWEKGRVEKNVQDSRRRIWIDASKRRFGSFNELNARLSERCRALWSEVRHPEYSQFSVAEMLEHERPHLMPMPAPFDGYVEKSARVSSTRVPNPLSSEFLEWVKERDARDKRVGALLREMHYLATSEKPWRVELSKSEEDYWTGCAFNAPGLSETKVLAELNRRKAAASRNSSGGPIDGPIDG